MTLNEYQDKALSTAIYPNDGTLGYLALAMCGEAGELADKVKKILRDKNGECTPFDARAIALELGDTLWYAANLARVLGFSLSDVAKLNIEKIENRIRVGTLHGSGDYR